MRIVVCSIVEKHNKKEDDDDAAADNEHRTTDECNSTTLGKVVCYQSAGYYGY